MTIIRFDSLESTNKYCEALVLSQVGDFTCYWALEQTAGIGQRGNHWHSSSGKNLTFSLVLHPIFLPADRQFKLTQALSLALVDFLSIFNFQFSIQIKWPNDIYVGDKKICGVLIENRIHGRRIKDCIIGIGLNINQTTFRSDAPNPVSIKQIEEMVNNIETKIQSSLDREITTMQIGELAMEEIKKVDEVSYVRFASVYRQFKDINTFMEELNKLLTEKK